ncbi:MAG: YgiQ family radical SAM protein [bacterium]|nr:YgiQ family radical SAM protein [bacterium]
MSNLQQPGFLPTNKKEMKKLGWDELDVLLISGDAYVDHPSFACAVLGRYLISQGFRTGLIAQPRWDSTEDFIKMGRPRLFAGISAGALDSMLAHYTAFRKKRHDDAFTPGGKAGARPNRAIIVYTNLIKQAFPGLITVIGGIEASLRRITHYDFWTSSLRRSILLDSKADYLVYGMGETSIAELAASINQHPELAPSERPLIKGTCVICPADHIPENAIELPSHEEIEAEPRKLLEAALLSEEHIHLQKKHAIQKIGQRVILIAPPVPPLSENQMDRIYDLPYTRKAHPSYKEPVPAEQMINSSLNSHRGCGGGCSFCSIALHQGRRISSRSRKSILREARLLTENGNFRGSITDVGGPSANMWQGRCRGPWPCRRSSCLFPSVCPNFDVPQDKYIDLLRDIRELNGIKHVRIASGIRCDLALTHKAATKAYIREFTGGQLKIAPEHASPRVLKLMRKPAISVTDDFIAEFKSQSNAAGKEQYVIAYLMSAFPGCTDSDMLELKDWLRKHRMSPQQIQCFIPTPGTVATAMFYSGLSPDFQPIYVARTDAERLRQHGMIMPRTESADKKESPNQKGDYPRKPREGKPGSLRSQRQNPHPAGSSRPSRRGPEHPQATHKGRPPRSGRR